MPSSAKSTLYDLAWDPRLRRIIHSVLCEATVRTLRDTLFDAGITTLDQAQAELHADSPYLQAIPAAERNLFLQALEQANLEGKQGALV